jgi:HEAT repeat protein
VARWCAGLLEGSIAPTAPSHPPLAWIGGRHAASLLGRNALGSRGQEYWPRVWGARGLMYVWSDDVRTAVIRGLGDPEWRVREMSARVVRARELADSETALVALASDPVPRVRVAALAALGRIGEVEHGEVVRQLLDDRDARVRRAASKALNELAGRLDTRF